MNKRQSITFGQTGQTLEVYPPEWALGAVTGTPTFKVWEALDSNDDDEELEGNATVDPVSTTIDVASGYSQTIRKRLYVTATTNTSRGVPLIVANALGQREIFTPDAISSGDYIDGEADLAYDYPNTTSTLKGWRVYATVDSTWVADESNLNTPSTPYRVLWTYTINSTTYKTWTYFDLVRQQKKHSLNVSDLIEAWPDIKGQEWIEQRGQGFAKQLDAAFERVEFDSRLHGVDLNQLREGQLFDELMRSATLWMLARAGICPGGRSPEAFLDESRQQYEKDFMQAVGILKVPVDQGTEGAITENPFRQPTFKR